MFVEAKALDKDLSDYKWISQKARELAKSKESKPAPLQDL